MFKQEKPFEERVKKFQEQVLKLAKKYGVDMFPTIQIADSKKKEEPSK